VSYKEKGERKKEKVNIRRKEKGERKKYHTFLGETFTLMAPNMFLSSMLSLINRSISTFPLYSSPFSPI
jgi:hypothetical protein